MPELPEVETIIRGLSRHLVGRRIANVEFPWPGLVVGDVDETTRQLRGQRITSIRRHGKYIVVELARARQKSCLVIHLRMTGNLLINGEPGPYTRAILYLEGGPALVYHDIRKFGRWQWSPVSSGAAARAGSRSARDFRSRFPAAPARAPRHGQGAAARPGVPARVGQHLLPTKRCSAPGFIRVRTPHASAPRARHRLWDAIRDVLNDAIAQGGSTISNYVDSNGAEGYFQLSTFVYGKTGENCKKCKSADPPDRHRQPQHAFLPALPAAVAYNERTASPA